MDTMTYLALTATGLPKHRIIGMGGALDSAGSNTSSATPALQPDDLNAVVVGGHGDTTMIPLIRLATWNSAPVTKFLSATAAEDRCRHHGRWRHPHQTHRYLRLVCARSRRCCPGQIHSTRREKIIYLLRLPQWRVWSERYLPRVPVTIGRHGWERSSTSA